MTTSPKTRLITELLKHGDVFMGWQQLPDGTHVRTYHLHNSPLAEWHETHWQVDNTHYPIGQEQAIADRLRTGR